MEITEEWEGSDRKNNLEEKMMGFLGHLRQILNLVKIIGKYKNVDKTELTCGELGEKGCKDIWQISKGKKQAEGKLIKNLIEVLLLNNGGRHIQKDDLLRGYANPKK